MQISKHRETPLILIKQRENLGKIKDYSFGDTLTCRLINTYRRFVEACTLRLAVLNTFLSIDLTRKN